MPSHIQLAEQSFAYTSCVAELHIQVAEQSFTYTSCRAELYIYKLQSRAAHIQGRRAELHIYKDAEHVFDTTLVWPLVLYVLGEPPG